MIRKISGALVAGALIFVVGTARAADAPSAAGAQACAGCHADKVESFKATPHGLRLQAIKGVELDKACETCHGAGSAHAAGDTAAIFNPGKARGDKASETCLSCHAGEKTRMFWSGSAHDGKAGVSCVSCHKVHGGHKGLLAKPTELETCASCHRDVKALMTKRSTHPVRDASAKDGQGKMGCTSCHNPHGSQAEKLMVAKSVNDTCYSCHGEKKAPLLWEHGPVKEDCLICHNPHGTTNNKLLHTKVPRLCQSCHMQGRHQSGTFTDKSIYATGKACLNCHVMIHGSNHPSGTVLQR